MGPSHPRWRKQLLVCNYSPWKHRPPLCHLDRREAKWRDLRFSGPSLEMFSTERSVLGDLRFLFPEVSRDQ